MLFVFARGLAFLLKNKPLLLINCSTCWFCLVSYSKWDFEGVMDVCMCALGVWGNREEIAFNTAVLSSQPKGIV